jgi:3-methyladenine DNA glycosylase/8-oxoguanine DNA glycosylase
VVRLSPTEPPADAQRTWAATWPIDLARVLGPLQRGRFDPCQQRVGDRVVWRSARPADGPVLARLEQLDERSITCMAWGPGANWFVERLPELLGAGDDPSSFDCADHPLLAKLHRAAPWLRMPASGLVFEAMVGAVLEQRVTVREALDARNRLIRWHGDAPPASPVGMPDGMRVMPSPRAWLDVPSWDFHRAGVDVKRAATLRRCALVASRLDETAGVERTAAIRRLRSVRGIGVWTVAETRQRSCGDADLVSYGDTHLARFVGYALTGESADDERMEELLEPWRGHRHRVVRLLHLGASLGAVRTAPALPRARPRAHLGF